jgi:ATP-dependent Clp protease, protease subunit
VKTVTVRAKSDDTIELLLYDVIGEDWFGGISAKTFAEQLKDIKAKTINLRINSPGGAVFDGFSMYESLKKHKARIEVDVDGVAASAASVVAMAGDEIRISENGFMMIHEPFGGVLGTADDMRHTAGLLDKVAGQIVSAYEKRTKNKSAQLTEWMKAETWFTSSEAVEAGFADRATEHKLAAATADFSKFAARYKRIPEAVTKPAYDETAWEETRKRQAAAAKLTEMMG